MPMHVKSTGLLSVGGNAGDPLAIRKNTLGLTRLELECVLDRLDARSDSARYRRGGKRLPFRVADLQVVLHYSLGASASITVAGRNLSRTGCSFLHSAYMHIGTKCTLDLPHKVKGSVRVEGVIARCRHVEMLVHEIGVKFNEPIRLHDYVRVDTLSEQFSHELVDPSLLSGSVLVISEYEFDRSLVRSLLEGTQIHVATAASIAEGVKAAKRGVDLILADSCAASVGLPEFVSQVRNAGHSGPLVLMGPELSRDVREQARRLRIDAIVSQPVERNALLSALAEFLVEENQGATVGGQDGVIQSTLPMKNGVASLINDFVGEMHKAAQRIDKAIQTRDMSGVQREIIRIVGTAGSMGFGSVGCCAEQAHRSLAASGSLEESLPAIRNLFVTLLRTRAA